ncbi:unnamed protein product [Zymoseptoria tritici ST99CH_3D1]|nr:unnamed protein product [Zymoseptoria tritici ST99CH_3D1]
MLGPPTQQQQPQPQQQQQSYPQYQSQPQHPQYAQESRQQHSQHPQQQYPSSSRPQSGEMNPYQQYANSYGQQPGQYAQNPSQPQQHPQQQQQGHPSQQHQLQQAQRGYIGHQLPPLGPPMGSVPPPPGSYMPGQSMPPQQSQQPHGPPSIRTSQPAAPQKPRDMAFSSAHNGYIYSLEVVQQPQRARMCGFGDKDRRPITPPPCVRLVIVDEKTGREVDIDNFPSDPSFFLLQCDLWAENADREANVVRASSNSPAVSISSATTTSYPPPVENGPRHMHEQPHSMYIDSNGTPVYSTMPGYPILHRTGSGGGAYAQPGYPGAYYPQMGGPPVQYMPPQAAQPASAMYTRNLIGSLTVNAAKLNDDNKKPGYWFVLQDLSVRTEGYFRLRMGFVDISAPPAQPPPSTTNGSGTTNGGVNRGKARTLAWVYSAPFQVYSAKKFPGVIESTPLSKAFAQQGIKIPIRKDNKGDEDEGLGEE